MLKLGIVKNGYNKKVLRNQSEKNVTWMKENFFQY